MSQVIDIAGLPAPAASPQGTFSATTVQVGGVDEEDLVKYDGRYVYSMRPQTGTPAAPLSA